MASTTESKPPAAFARWGLLINALIVAAGYLLSRVLGLVRDIIISNTFGTSVELSAFRAAFGVLDLIYLVVAGGALGSAFIPVFSSMLTKNQQEEAWRLASGILNLALVALVVACVLIALLAEPLVALTIGRGFEPENRALIVQILRLLLIQPVLLGVGGIAKATLESFERFSLPAIGANLYNIGIIGGALLLSGTLGIYGLVWGVVIGAGLFLLVQLPGLVRVGARYTARVARSTPGLGQVGRLLAPRLFGQAAWQINMIAIVTFAGLISEAAVAANAYAFTLMLLPHGLLALSLGTAIFPQLTRHYAAGDLDALRDAVLGALRSVVFLSLLAAVLLGILGVPIVRLLFQHGQFDTQSTALTVEALRFYALGLVAFAAVEIVVRSFYAMQDTRTPVIVGIITVLLNIALAWVLLPLGLGGLTLAFSIATIVETAVLVWLLRGRIGGLNRSFWRAIGAMVLAALLAGALLVLVLYVSAQYLPFLRIDGTYQALTHLVPLALWLAAAAVVTGAAYGGIAALLGLPEVRVALGRGRSLLARIRRRA